MAAAPRTIPSLAWAWIVILLLATQAAFALVPIPELTGRVVDLTGTLSQSEIQNLDAKLAAFENQKGSQVAVLIVPTTAPEAIEQFSIRVVDKWQLGRKKNDDGALLLVAKNDRTLRIEVGYGLEGALTDLVAKRIISDVMTPFFRSGDIRGGIEAGTDAILKVIQGEDLPAPPASGRSGGDNGTGGGMGGGVLMAIMVGAMFLRSIFGRVFGGILAGGLIGVAASFFLGSLVMGLVLGLVAFIFVLVSGSMGGGMLRGGRGFGGGGFGGRGGFGGGGGGFGGGFGGGGASGRW